MQTHKFKGKLFDVEYSSVKILEIGEELRVDSQFYDVIYLQNEDLIKTKKYCKIDDLLEKKQYGLSLAMNEESQGYKILKMDDIIGVLASAEKAKFADIEEKQFLNTKLEIGDVLFNRVNSEDFVGRTGIYLIGGEHTFASYLVRLRAKEYYSNFYITIFLNSKQGRLSLNRVKRRAVNQANINAVELGNLFIPIPSQSFQEKTQELVIESYKQKELSEKLYKESESLLLQELDLLNYKPKTKNINLAQNYNLEVLENHSTTNYSILKGLDRFDAEYWDYDFVEIRNRAKNIKSEKLGELVNYKKGVEVGSEAYIEESEVETIDDKKYFVRVSNFSKFGMNYNNAKFIKNSHFETLKDYQPKKGEILFSKDGTAGITYLLREDIDGIISGGILRFQNISSIPSDYIELVLNSILIQKEIERQTNGALIQHLKITDTLNFDIPLIGDDKIKIITDKIQKSFEAKTKSKNLLEVAKKGVEIYIEEDENAGFEFIEKSLQIPLLYHS